MHLCVDFGLDYLFLVPFAFELHRLQNSEVLTGCGLKGKHGLASVYFQSIKIWCIHSTQLWVPVLCVMLGALNRVVRDRHGSSHRGLGACVGK